MEKTGKGHGKDPISACRGGGPLDAVLEIKPRNRAECRGNKREGH